MALIVPNPHQPRQTFEPEALAELSRSIAQVGILQPLSVRRVGETWELIAGERRLRAAQMAGLSTVPCIPTQVDERTSSLLALIENLQRADLTVWEEAEAICRLVREFSLSQEEVGRKLGISQSAVANKMRLLRLPDDIIDRLKECGLSERHARALLRLPNPQLQRQALDHIRKHHLTVAASERYIEGLLQEKPRKATPIFRTKDVRLFFNAMKRSLAIMQSAGINAHYGQEENDEEITLTIHIPKPAPPSSPS